MRILAVILLLSVAAQANGDTLTVSPSSCSTTACYAGTLTPWVNPARAVSSNGQWATSAIQSGATLTECLYCVFGSNLSSLLNDSVVNGITVSVERSRGANVTINDEYIQLVTDDGSLAGNNKATATAWPSSDATATYGGVSDTWGLAGICATTNADCADSSHTNVKDSDFGVVVAAEYQSGAGNTAYVDHVQLSLDYSPGPTPTPTITNTPTITLTPSSTPTSTPTSPPGLTCVNIPFQTYANLSFSSSSGNWTGIGTETLQSCNGATSYAQNNAIIEGGYSNALRASNLDLTGIPATAEFYGFIVTVEAASVVAANHDEYLVSFVNGSSSIVGDNKAVNSMTTGYAQYEFGASYDRWGNNYCIEAGGGACTDPSKINLTDTDVGIAVSYERTGAAASAMRVSCVTIEGCYVDAVPPPTFTSGPSETPTSTPVDTATPTPASTNTPTNTPGPTATFTPLPTTGKDRGFIPQFSAVKQTSQTIIDSTAVPLLDWPGDSRSACINWIEVSSAGQSVVSLASGTMTIDIPFADQGYVFNDWGSRCFPPGEIVSLDQTAASNAVRVNVSYFVK